MAVATLRTCATRQENDTVRLHAQRVCGVHVFAHGHLSHRRSWARSTGSKFIKVVYNQSINQLLQVAYALIPSESCTPIRTVLRALKNAVVRNHGEKAWPSPTHIMTDDQNSFVNAWRDEFKLPVQPQHLLCTYHLVENFKKNAKVHIKDSTQQRTAVRLLRQLTTGALSRTEFKQRSAALFNFLGENLLDGFINYLRSHYFTEERLVKWAGE